MRQLTSRPIRSVLFDFDDTLVDTAAALVRLDRHWYQTLASENRPGTEEEFISRMFEPLPDPFNPRDFYIRMLEIWPGCFESIDAGMASHNALMPKMVRLGARTGLMLRDLRRDGIPVGVVTNGDAEVQWNKVRNTGVSDLVDAVVVSGEFGSHKPDPAIFRHALGKIGSSATETLFVGDNPVADVAGAARVGMHTAWMRHGRSWESGHCQPDHVIDDVWEVRELLGI